MIRFGRVGLAATDLGVSRYDIAAGPRATHLAVTLARRWCHDRVLPAHATLDLCRSVEAAVDAGPHEGSTSVTVALRWADVDRVRVDLVWHGRDGTRTESVVVDTSARSSRAAGSA